MPEGRHPLQAPRQLLRHRGGRHRVTLVTPRRQVIGVTHAQVGNSNGVLGSDGWRGCQSCLFIGNLVLMTWPGNKLADSFFFVAFVKAIQVHASSYLRVVSKKLLGKSVGNDKGEACRCF